MSFTYQYLTLKVSDHQLVLAELSKLDAIIKTSLIKEFVLGTTLFGSYPRATMIPDIVSHPLDIDVLIITNLEENASPLQLREKMLPIFFNTSYDIIVGNRSIALVNEVVRIDLVFAIVKKTIRPQGINGAFDTAQNIYHSAIANKNLHYAPYIGKEFESLSSLFITNFADDTWVIDAPFGLITWTKALPEQTQNSYMIVVKLFKLIVKLQSLQNEPCNIFNYPIERLISTIYPKVISEPTTAFICILRRMLQEFEPFTFSRQVPSISDISINNNVFRPISPDSFKCFYHTLKKVYKHLDVLQIEKKGDLDLLIHQIKSIY